MEIHEEFTHWARERGVKINGIAAHKFEGRGLGIIAEKRLKANSTLLTVPLSALITSSSLPKSITRAVSSSKATVHNLLATFLALDNSPSRAPWHAVLPSHASFTSSIPLLWPISLQSLLPPQAAALVANQQSKLSKDWSLTTASFPTLSYEKYLHCWLLVNTRTFYFVSPTSQKAPPNNRDDCMALNPFADYFNHTAADTACEVNFSAAGYTVTTAVDIEQGEELYISYGSHSNDFLLAEYGFVIGEGNQWDEVKLDVYVLELLSKGKKEALEEEGFLGNYMLDRETVCYRTQVALRLACVPIEEWRRYVRVADGGEKDQAKVDELLLEVLKKYLSDVAQKIKLVDSLTDGTANQIDTLSRRWKQIDVLLQSAIDRIQS
ncbi:SET domain-containing protein [Marssonina coronariae]|uniref:SET domain-containing protein n=1 Tax=Diplocarpon coronariae TaxID=2795749 RepID=A0A218ZG51_9HELO|nr:SET domain-containing protein [Marssonina coronariae]